MWNQVPTLMVVTKSININNNKNSNNIINNRSISDSENKNINISDIANNSIIINNIVNRSVGENCVKISNFLNNVCLNIYVTWYRLYYFLLGGRDVYIIDLNYEKE